MQPRRDRVGCDTLGVVAFACAGAGFLLAVLWFDLMHDVQVRGADADAALPEPVLASIAGYYAQVTTGARPMNRLVAVAMAGTVVATIVEVVRGLDPAWVAWLSLVLTVVAVGIAASRTVAAAVRLGTRQDPAAGQSELARRILRDHELCFACIAAVLVLQLGAAVA